VRRCAGKRRPCLFRQDPVRSRLSGSQSVKQERAGIKQLGLFIDDKIAPELGQQANEPLIIAHRASVFFGTDLQARLSAQGIETLVMVGIASTGVVLSSIAYASDADFRLLTVKDCCYDPDQVVHDHLFSTAFDSRTTVLSLADALLLLA
jgi:nicotinamidase-related amidase